MIKQNQKKLNVLHVTMDLGISFFSGVSSFFMYQTLFDVNIQERFNNNIYAFLAMLLGTAILQIVCNRSFELYRSYRSTRFMYELTNILKSGLTVFAVLVVLAVSASRLHQFQIPLMFYFIVNTMVTASYRFALRKFLRMMRKKGYNKKYIIIIGVNNCTNDFIKKIRSSPNLGYEISGYFDKKENKSLGLKYFGKISNLDAYFANSHPDEAVIMLKDSTQDMFEEAVAVCEGMGVKFSIIPNLFSTVSNRIYISSFDGIPVMSMRKVPLDMTFNKILKRLLDLVISLLMLIILSPLMAVTASIIKATSKGPVIFRQERVGINNRSFIMYKFRSMKTETEEEKAMTEKDDPRCTTFGRFIRKYSIDELPQLVNVLKGDMSLVGPRPEIPYYVEQFRKSIPLYMVKHYVKPGITGWAQVNDLRGGDTSIEERIKYDLYYIENWSVAFDFSILLRTITKIVNSKTAR